MNLAKIAILGAAVLSLTSSVTAHSSDQIFENSSVGIGLGISGEMSTETPVAGSTNATFAIRYATILRQQECYGYRCYPGKKTGIAYVNLDVVYNVIGINSTPRATTAIGLKFDGGAFGDLRIGSDKCGFYAGGSGQLDANITANQAGSTSVDASIGTETGLYCQLDNGVVILVSPTARLSAAYINTKTQITTDGSFSAAGFGGGVVARFILAEKFYSTFRVERSIVSFATPSVDAAGAQGGATATRASADLNFRIAESWLLNFFVKYLRLESGVEKDSSKTQDIRAGGSIIRTF